MAEGLRKAWWDTEDALHEAKKSLDEVWITGDLIEKGDTKGHWAWLQDLDRVEAEYLRKVKEFREALQLAVQSAQETEEENSA